MFESHHCYITSGLLLVLFDKYLTIIARKPTRPKAELAKIRRYHASLSAIIVLEFNTLITKQSLKRKYRRKAFYFCILLSKC